MICCPCGPDQPLQGSCGTLQVAFLTTSQGKHEEEIIPSAATAGKDQAATSGHKSSEEFLPTLSERKDPEVTLVLAR